MAIKIISAKVNGKNRWGARKYACVPSRSRKTVKHTVVKARKRYDRNYKYFCTCEDFINRQRPCWHIKQFKNAEAVEREARRFDRIIGVYADISASRVAWLKKKGK